MDNGIHAVGIFNGVESQPWRNDPQRFNHRIILNRPFKDRYNNDQIDVTLVEIVPDDLPRIQSEASKYHGKQVIVPVIPEARKGGNSGAFLSVRMPKGSIIHTLDQGQKQAS